MLARLHAAAGAMATTTPAPSFWNSRSTVLVNGGPDQYTSNIFPPFATYRSRSPSRSWSKNVAPNDACAAEKPALAVTFV